MVGLKRGLYVFFLFLSIFFILNLWNIIFWEDTHKASTETDNFNNIENNISEKRNEYYIHINLDEYKMYVYKDNELIHIYSVSGGKPSTPSPQGKWKIVNKDKWGEGFGGAWMGLNVPWGKYGIHGTVYPWFVGKANVSKGCIRMKNKDAKELYSFIPYGTVVSIEHKAAVFRAIKNGDIGYDVYLIQSALKDLGYYKGYVDGKFGEGSMSCVKKFQKSNNLNVTGIVDKKTHNKIFETLEKQRKNTSQIQTKIIVDSYFSYAL